ncbi:Zinc finger, RanBP2-type [Dillenia turbinata]|uniref:Zinc finger, RanBP2-type n=1 Tax=Dillenia turbinata TaxID=194707 RepID=A0AAN8UJE6_9MAGN
MAPTLLSLLLRRSLSKTPKPYTLLIRPYFRSHASKSFSTSTDVSSNPSDPNKPSSLSARLSFVFDQIDAIDKSRSEKDETLQRIRAWRESKKQQEQDQQTDTNNNKSSEIGELGLGFCENVEMKTDLDLEGKRQKEGLVGKEVELVHPWPEWIELMERLVQQNYFDHRRKDEDKMIEELGFRMSDVAEEGFDFTRDWKTVQTACLNFGRDRFDILRSLSRQDIQMLVGYGCPSADRKVVFSGKLLRKHAHLDEGDVCSSCSLRSSCEKAYLLTNKEDEARTIDVMRILLSFGFDPINGSVTNMSLLKQKSVKTVVRKLLHEVVKLSAVPIDPNLPPPVIKKPPPKVKQPPPPPKKRVGRDDIEMKKGDWLCPKCDFMNFAKNTICLQCDAKRPKRQLLPGEWECPECNFLNYRRNMACFHCECKRPTDSIMENHMQDRQRGPRTNLERIASRPEVSNAWNFNFDDDESDGADVAAFEFADTPRMDEDFPSDRQEAKGMPTDPSEDIYSARRTSKGHEEEFSNPGRKSRIGFDDFDDDEDDIDSYELDTQNTHTVKRSSPNDFSELEGFSDSDGEDSDYNIGGRHRTNLASRAKPSKPMGKRASFSDSEDNNIEFNSEDELPIHPNWKSSHVANSRQRGRGAHGSSRGIDSDDDLGLNSGSDDDLGSSRHRRNNSGFRTSKFRRGRGSDFEDETFSGSDSDDSNFHSHRNKFGGSKPGRNTRGNTSNARGDFRFVRDGTVAGRKNILKDELYGSSRRSKGYNNAFEDDHGGPRSNGRGRNLRDFRSPRRGGYGNQQIGRSENYFDRESDLRHEKIRRRVIER